MKKVLLFAVALCFMISAQAQTKTRESADNQLRAKVMKVEQLNRQTMVFTQKLDSIIAADGLLVEKYEYDNQLRIKKLTISLMGLYSAYDEFFYDDQDHLTQMVSHYYDGDQDKVEYSYNAQGWLIEAIKYDLEDGNWTNDEKTTYERDSQGNLTSATEYRYDDYNEQWVKNWLEEYTYSQGRLATMTESWWSEYDNAWIANNLDEYTYNSDGNCVQQLSSHQGENAWVPDDKVVYDYDNHGNCIKSMEYEADDTSWILENVAEYTYDPTVLVENIAGFGTNTVGEDVLGAVNGLYCKNKLVSVTSTDIEDNEVMNIFLFYSNCTGVGENSETLLNVWPNPATETLNLNAEGLQQVEIFSMDGKQVMHLENGLETIHVDALANGCYLLKATFTDGTMAMQKFVKE